VDAEIRCRGGRGTPGKQRVQLCKGLHPEEQLRGERGLGRKLWRPRQHHCMPEPVGPAVVLISVLWAMRRGMVGFKSLKEKKWWP
jgi:hypothetical protein